METTVQDSNIADKSPAWDGDARIHRPVQGSWLLVMQLHLNFFFLPPHTNHPSASLWWPDNSFVRPITACLVLG